MLASPLWQQLRQSFTLATFDFPTRSGKGAGLAILALEFSPCAPMRNPLLSVLMPR